MNNEDYIVLRKSALIDGKEVLSYMLYDKKEQCEPEQFFLMLCNESVPDAFRKVEWNMPHIHNCYQLRVTFDEEYIFHKNDCQYQVNGNAMTFIGPRQVHTSTAEENARSIHLFFTEDYMPILTLAHAWTFKYDMFKHGAVLSLKDAENFADVRHCLTLLKNEYERTPCLKHMNKLYIQALLFALFTQISRLPSFQQRRFRLCGEGNPNHHDLFLRFISLVEERHKQWRKPMDYVSVLGCSTRTLSTVTYKYAKQSPSYIIDKVRIRTIKNYLTFSAMPVELICEQMGFHNTFSLERFFKKHAGVSLLEYRETKQ